MGGAAPAIEWQQNHKASEPRCQGLINYGDWAHCHNLHSIQNTPAKQSDPTANPQPRKLLLASFKGIIRPFKLKEFDIFYYSKDTGKFSFPMICIKPPLVAYLERNSLFNFDKTVLSYVKTVVDSPALSTSFQKGHRRLRIFTDLETTQTTTSGAGDTKSGIYSKTVVIEQKRIQKRHSVNRQ